MDLIRLKHVEPKTVGAIRILNMSCTFWGLEILKEYH